MPNPRRNVKDEFWVVVLVAVIIVAALITMWWKWIILGVVLVALVFALVFILKAVFKNVASEREPLSPYERNAVLKPSHNIGWDDINTRESFIKGEAFQDYIRKYLFTKDKFAMLHRAPSYEINKNDYISEDSEKPDFKFRVIRTGEAFWVEAKYRSTYYEDKVEWCKPFQLERYKEIDKELPVYIALAVGGEPGSPAQIFLIPVKDIKWPKLFRSFLKNYRVPNDKPIDYKRLQ